MITTTKYSVFLLLATYAGMSHASIALRDYVTRADPVWNVSLVGKVQHLTWMSGAFVGNGMLGIMLTTENGGQWGAPNETSVLRLKIGRVDVWDTRVNGSSYSIGKMETDTPRWGQGEFVLVETIIIPICKG